MVRLATETERSIGPATSGQILGKGITPVHERPTNFKDTKEGKRLEELEQQRIADRKAGIVSSQDAYRFTKTPIRGVGERRHSL